MVKLYFDIFLLPSLSGILKNYTTITRLFMPKIHELSLNEIHKIAAGQVIERPVNIVKELIENSIDAGATTIIVRIIDGGKQRIEVADNGCGMDSLDAEKCFLKHATSKIRQLEELDSIKTFGFRGEALAAIKTVAKVTLLTREQGITGGTMVQADEHTLQSTHCACPQGTTIIIEKLFETIPARKKFLKPASTESRAIIQTIQAYALQYLEINFELFIDNIMIINAPSQSLITEKAAHLFDQRIVNNLIYLEEKNKEIGFKGIITDHQYATYDRTQIMITINNRWIKNQKLTSALIKGYMGILPSNKFPFAFCALTIDQTLIDVNINPKKDDVSFVHPRIVENALQTAIETTLKKNNLERITPTQKQDINNFFGAQPTFWHQPSPVQPQFAFQNSFEQIIEKPTITNTIKHEKIIVPQAIQESHAEPLFYHEPIINQTPIEQKEQSSRFLGVYKNTYLLIDHIDGFLMIDQHAAHERVLYEQFENKFHVIESVQLLFAQILEFSPEHIEILQPWFPLIKHNGIDIELFGQTQVLIQSVPVFAKEINIHNLLLELVTKIQEKLDTKEEAKNILTHTIRAHLACKAAVKAGDTLTQEQYNQLIADLSQCSNHMQCPHGRPTTWLIKHEQIEKNFKRIK